MYFPIFSRLLFFLTYSLIPTLLFGQYYNLGQDPAALKWRQITTTNFKLIYPETFEPKAQKMIPVLDFLNSQGNKTLSYIPKRLPLIVHNYNTRSNAVTVWAPKRVELYTTPPQDSYAQNWLDQLMIHEYRHVVQIDRTNQGFTKMLSWLTGEQAATIINGIFVPSWFMEGDAVCTETVMSNSGRGRIPSFEMLLRAQVLQKGAFTYDKAALGSYKIFVPNQYSLGYVLVANVRRKYSYHAWVTALDEVARKPFIVTPFNKGLKNATGFSKEKLYSVTMYDMDSLWKYQDLHTTKTTFTQLTKLNKNKYDNYRFPDHLNDTLLVSEYTSLDDITRFVLTGPNGYRKILTTPGLLSSDMFSIVEIKGPLLHEALTTRNDSMSNYLLAWAETIDDPRWSQRNYSVIKVHNLKTEKTLSLTSKSRYFAPSFSPDGLTLAAVSVDPANRSSIVLIDVKSGLETDTIITSDSNFYMTPSWCAEGSKIVFTKLDSYGKSIEIFDLKTRSLKTVVPSTFIEISNPVFAANFVLFNGSFSGIENVFATDLHGNEIWQVTSAEFGACDADISADGKKIVYSNYSSFGNSLVETDFNPVLWKKLSDVLDYSPSLYKHLVAEENALAGLQTADSVNYLSAPYRKIDHLLNFHSWAPGYINYMTGEYGTGVSFMSQNDMSTATTVIGYQYDMYENTGKVTANFSWEGWYPIIDLNTSLGARAAYTGGDSSVRYNFNETTISGGFTLPLLFTGGQYYKGLRLRMHTSFYNITNTTSPEDNKLTGTINTIDYSITAYRYIKQSVKDLYPRWGQYLITTFRHSPLGENNLGSIFSAGIRLYFPGVIRHHGIRIDFNHQVKNFGHYAFSNQIALPRGYLAVNDRTLTSFMLNYKFPFAYPDLALGPILYLKRLKANLFYDGGIGITDGESHKQQSTGAEVTADLHILRFIFPVDIGFRFGYRPIEKQYFSDVLFSLNL